VSRRFASALLLVVSLSCHGTQELHSFCLEQPGSCPPCARDDDCEIVSNPCLAHASCADKRVHLSVIQIGCTSGYEVPDPSQCVCRKALCQVR
jgi:hypothetical protein